MPSKIIGQSEALRNCLDYVSAVALSDAAVLVSGASGVGKDLIAQEIHAQSPRASKPLITVNCASVPRELFESEFFGHVKGAFTGATRDRAGRFEAAHRGTLFLDEVGEIPPELQGKLLRALQQSTFERVGDDKTRHVDVRVISATNRDLSEDVEAGRFRRDLYYRISTFPIDVPPLRDRLEDVHLLAEAFVDQLARKYRCKTPNLSKRDQAKLIAYDWPGNIRELKNVIERAFVLGRAAGKLNIDLAIPDQRPSTPAASRQGRRGYLTATEFEDLERNNLVAALETARWKVSGDDGAAALLGVKPTTLASRMKALKIERPLKSSLYWKLGGERFVASLSRDLLGRLQADPQLGRFWIYRSNVGVQREEKQLTLYLCAALGGAASPSGCVHDRGP